MYAELHCHSYFSLLDAASSPEALAARAQALGLHALALTDHDSLAGAVRFWTAAQRAGLHAVIGAELTLAGDQHLTLLAESQDGYANLCRLITAARRGEDEEWRMENGEWAGKVAPAVDWAQLERHRAGLIALTGCRQGPLAAPLLRGDEAPAVEAARRLRDLFGPDHLFVELQHHDLPDDDRLLRRLLPLAHRLHLPLVATHNVHYAEIHDSRLRDALIAVRHNQPLTAARQAGRLPLNSSYALAGPAEMARRFRELPAALHNSVAIAGRCQVSLDFSGRRLPTFPTPDGQSEFEHLYELCHANLHRRYPHLTPAVLKQLAHELDIIERAGLAGYFLIVWDLVRFAREQGIRCQGRGSAANSIVAYLLEITRIDPLQHNLLFERFLSEDKFTMPDIDIDFAADRREEVIQYVYRRYGVAHAAMVCNVVTYRARSALRDLGKALDFPSPAIERLIAGLDTHSPTAAAQLINSNFEFRISNLSSHPLALLADLLRRIDGCPRHLSIHSGGMLITGPRLDEVVPLEPATMPGRLVCQWDKDSVEDAGLIKIDLLGLGGLGLISEALAHIQAHDGQAPDIDALSLDDPEIYRMLQQADTVGAFQVESRAQQQMLPRLRPACFEDIAVQVAIVRPGPIQGGAVHPYLRRRARLLHQQSAERPPGQAALATEPVTYLHPCLEPVLGETLGVLLFQEQAIRVSMAAASFSPGEADMLRRAMSRSRSDEAMAAMRARFLRGAQAQGIDAGTAEAIFAQLAGFAGYGFCKSHAASFALIAYQTMYLKRYHAPAFYCALLNQQPMGFYSTEVIVGDARRHGVDLRPPDVNRSGWRYTLEALEPRPGATPGTMPEVASLALRTGLCAVNGLGEAGWRRLEAARDAGPFADLRDLCRRTRLPRDVVSTLIRAGACDAFGRRRELLWQLGDIDYRPDELDLALPTLPAELPELSALTEMVWEYELLGLSPAGQVMGHYRDALRRAGVLSVWQIKQADGPPAGQRVRVAGMVAVRQRPATAKGITFISLEDESGLLDLVVKPEVYPALREVLHYAVLLWVEGVVQRAGGAVSVLVQRATQLRCSAL